MDINGKIIELLIASGNVSKEKVEQARKLAESLKWEDEHASQQSVEQTAKPCIGCGSTLVGYCRSGCTAH